MDKYAVGGSGGVEFSSCERDCSSGGGANKGQ